MFNVTDQYRKKFIEGRHLPFLDGLRGIAILLVLFYHATMKWTSSFKYYSFKPLYLLSHMGWTGVNLFFILSGMLITNILLTSKGEENYYKKFYFRRLLRIAPLYYFALFISAFVKNYFPNPLHHLFFATNFLMVENGTSSMPTSWSLATEEQFYLIWPFIIFYFSRQGLRSLTYFLIFVAVAIKLSSFMGNLSYEFLYYSFVTRMDGLAMGSLLALRLNNGPIEKRDLTISFILIFLGLIGVIFVNVDVGTFEASINHRMVMGIGDFAVNLFYLGLIYFVLTTSMEWPRRILNIKLLRLFGKHSYALYLFHLLIIHYFIILYVFLIPNLVKFNFILAEMIFYMASTLLCLVFSILIWHLVEKHLLKYKNYFQKRSTNL